MLRFLRARDTHTFVGIAIAVVTCVIQGCTNTDGEEQGPIFGDRAPPSAGSTSTTTTTTSTSSTNSTTITTTVTNFLASDPCIDGPCLLFEQKYCATTSQQDLPVVHGGSGGEIGKDWALGSLCACEQKCRSLKTCTHYSYTEDNDGECMLFDTCPAGKTYGDGSVGTKTYSIASCPKRCTNPDALEGGTDARTKYQLPSVIEPASCQSERQTRSCNNGTWSPWIGSYSHDSCIVEPSIDCVLTQGGYYACPSGYERVWDEPTCRACAQVLQMGFVGYRYGNDKPKGCHNSGGIHMGTGEHSVYAWEQMVCKRS